MTNDTIHTPAPNDSRLVARILIGLLLTVVVVALGVMQFGLAALTFVALIATVVVFAVILAFSAGK